MTYCLLTDEEISISHELPSYYPKATCETINKTVISSKITYELFDDNATNSGDNPIGYSTEMDEPIVLAAPSRYAYGEAVYTCECGNSYYDEIAPYMEHIYETTELKQATCGSGGEIKHYCARCGESYIEYTSATGKHTYTTTTEQAKASENGKIVPKATIISKLTKKSKGFKVNIKKQKTQTTGYEIQYSTKKNLKNTKTVRIASKTTSKTITGLSAKKKYYVRVRTYKTVNGKRIYSEWSKTKSVTTKK